MGHYNYVLRNRPFGDRRNHPLFVGLNRQWHNSLTHHFPSYSRLEPPLILPKFLVLFHKTLGYNPLGSHKTLALWVYICKNTNIWILPVLPIPKLLHRNVKFVCDVDEEHIYFFTLHFKSPPYNVNVIDSREGNNKWRRLPYFPFK